MQSFQPVIQAIIELAEHAAKDPWPLPEPTEEEKALKARVDALARAGLAEAYREPVKQARHDKVDAVRKKAAGAAWPPRAWTPEKASALFHDLEADIVRNAILDTGMRIDGRDTKTVRPIVAEVGILPRAHGSALFTRGETQAFCVATLGHRPGRADHRRAGGRIPRALHAALQFPALLGGRGRPHGLARAGARSVTASWPGARSTRCCRRRTSSPTRCASCRRSPNPTALRRWPRCAAARWR